MKTKKIILMVEENNKAMDRAFKVLKNKSQKYKGHIVISFPDYETLGKVITGARLEILNVINQRKPKSIQELARMVDRDFKNVYADVKLLSDFGLIVIKESGQGKPTAISTKFSEIVLAA